jgi:hypothetical protein
MSDDQYSVLPSAAILAKEPLFVHINAAHFFESSTEGNMSISDAKVLKTEPLVRLQHLLTLSNV